MIKLPEGVTVYAGAGRYKGEVPDHLSSIFPDSQESGIKDEPDKKTPKTKENKEPEKDK